MGTLVRPILETERSLWEGMLLAYADFYKVDLAPGAADTVWGWIHDPGENFWCDVALSKYQKIVGFTQYQLMHRSLVGGKVCYLSDLYVDPVIRGTGTGKALINNVFKFAKERGISNVRWLTQENNYPARKVYDTYGPKSDFILYSFPLD